MPSTKAYAFVFVGAIAALILFGVAGSMLQRSGWVRDEAALETPVKIFVFAIFLVMGLTAIPLMLRLFLAGQRGLGNESHALVRFLGGHETLVVAGFWSICLLGLAIAIPVMIKDGFFGRAATVWLEGRLAGRSEGVLTVNVGMTLDEVRRRSTLRVPEASPLKLTGATQLIAKVVFDLDIADTGTRFDGCRYYFMDTRPRGDTHVRSVNVGVSPHARTRAELEEEMRRTRERLRADGWALGRFVYRAPEDQRLHGGKTSEGEGFYWLKGETVLHLEPKRVDDEQRGQDPKTAGRWMLAITLWERESSPSYHRLEFTPSR